MRRSDAESRSVAIPSKFCATGLVSSSWGSFVTEASPICSVHNLAVWAAARGLATPDLRRCYSPEQA